MGHSYYNASSRVEREETLGYRSKPVEEIFHQQRLAMIHESMNPKGIVIRECRDSEAHPNTIPIQLYLDVTGSMGHIPHELVKDGLPTLMSTLIQRGATDAALMFGAVGDHEYDKHPLQIAQFESGDAELDMWLTRTYIEQGGGGNTGESYLLAWYFGSNHVAADAWEKRGRKGYIITIGDEPCLSSLPMSALKGIMGNTAAGQQTWTREVLLAAAQKNNNVFHIHVNHGGRRCDSGWKEMLGQNLIEVDDHTKIAKLIAEIIIKTENAPVLGRVPISVPDDNTDTGSATTPKITL